jgi:Zn-dependent protease with chaperone function
MKKYYPGKNFTLLALMSAFVVMPLAVFGQTRIEMPKNKYKVSDDVALGRKAAAEVDKQFPILNDADATRYLEQVGRRLVAAIPPQFQQPAFNYRFKLVNARDINAFALPGGPMYVNRGMIEAAKNEGEMAGVMAHEISHVALRHATAQETKRTSAGNQILAIGAILGGAVLGGESGAQLGAAAVSSIFLRYSRDYETQADILGAQIMAAAGYDPRDLANMFRTIQQQGGGGGGGGVDWFSSHPNPANRYEKINQEAGLLRVSGKPYKITRDFERVQSRFRGMSKAPSMEEIEKGIKTGQGGANTPAPNPTAGGKYTNSVAYPSTATRLYSSSGLFRVSIPNNWKDFPSGSEAQFAPVGAYGDQGITHGAMIGTYTPGGSNPSLSQASNDYLMTILEGNNYLNQRGSLLRTTLAGRTAYTGQLSGTSPVTGRTELVTVYTTQLSNGDILFVATVVPEGESSRYSTAFRNVINSLRITDQ